MMKWLWNNSRRWVVVTPFLREKALGIALASVAFLYLAVSFFEIPLWRCLWRDWTGTRCPGCGLTTGCKAFLRGHFVEGVSWNWLTPVVLLGVVAAPVFLAIPPQAKEVILGKIEAIERRSRFVLILILVALLQILARMLGWA